MIPEARQPAVARALGEAFGASGWDDIRPLAGGLSTALVFRILVGGRSYLLRVLSHTEALGDPSREFGYMKTAADAGLAPRIWYASVDDRVLITDFVERQPFPDQSAALLAPMLRRVHALNGFASPKSGNYFDVADRFVERFKAAQLLPADRTNDVLRAYDAVAKVYPRRDDLVASHNDLKPENIVFDGRRFWLVDWEAAFLNDRYVDLAVLANFFVTDADAESSYLTAYFGEPADEYQCARFYLVRQTVHLFYTTLLLLLAARAGTPIDPDRCAPDFRDFHKRLLAGESSAAANETKVDYALAHLEQARFEMASPRFDDALACVTATVAR